MKFKYILIIASLVCAIQTSVFAALEDALPSGIQNSQDAKSVIQTKGSKVIDILGMFGLFSCVAGAIYGGIKIGAGDPEKGKTTLISSLIGAGVILGVYSLIGVVVN